MQISRSQTPFAPPERQSDRRQNARTPDARTPDARTPDARAQSDRRQSAERQTPERQSDRRQSARRRSNLRTDRLTQPQSSNSLPNEPRSYQEIKAGKEGGRGKATASSKVEVQRMSEPASVRVLGRDTPAKETFQAHFRRCPTIADESLIRFVAKVSSTFSTQNSPHRSVRIRIDEAFALRGKKNLGQKI